MARAGDVIEAPAGRGLTGRAVFRKAAKDTDGELAAACSISLSGSPPARTCQRTGSLDYVGKAHLK